MGQAKNRGTYEQRRAESIAAAADGLRERAEKAAQERTARREESDAMALIARRRPAHSNVPAMALAVLLGGLTPR